MSVTAARVANGRAGRASRRLTSRADAAEALTAAVLTAALDAVVISRGDGRIIAFNPAAELMFGIAASRALTLVMADLIVVPSGSPASAGNVLCAFGERVELDAKRSDGSTFPADVAIRRVVVARRVRFATCIRDLSAQRRAETALDAESRRLHQVETLSAMGSLLAGVAHELNNPLAILVAQSTVLRDRAPDADIARRAERICAAAQRAGRIVKGFVGMTRQRVPLREAVDVDAVVDDALDLLGYGLRGAGIVVRHERGTDLPRIHADRELLGQVVVNLLLNAQQALSEQDGPRSISVRSRPEGRDVALEIADNGPGVPEKIADRVFDPYFTTRRTGTALGVGLSLCRSILVSHGGTVELVPSPDGGALFRVTLPVVDTVPGPAAPAAKSGLSILVVDDEADVAESLAELIELLGHRVAVETSAAAALDLIRAKTFDAAFVDLRMPGIDGLTLRRAIAAIDPPLMARTIIVTGDTVASRYDPSSGFKGRGHYLEKPFTVQDVEALLDQVAAS